MNVKKFIAPTAREALHKVKEILGPDAIILSNRGMPGGGVEIMAVASRDLAALAPTPVPLREIAPPPPAHSGARQYQGQMANNNTPGNLRPASRTTEIDDDYTVSLSSSRTQTQQNDNSVLPRRVALWERDEILGSAGSAQQGFREHSGRVEPAAYQNVFDTPVNRPSSAPVTGASPEMRSPAHTHAVSQAATQPAAQAITRATQLGTAHIASNVAAQAVAQTHLRPEAEVVPPAVMAEIRALRCIVEQQLAGFAFGEAARREPVKTEVLRKMLDSGFSPKLARELLTGVAPQMDVNQAQTWAKAAADRALHTLGSDHDIIERGGVFALVGPTGVGKTTTTAKLAARCVLRHGAAKLALVTTDGYRIGAHEQLRIYGRILGVSVHLVKDGDDLRHTLTDLSHKHMVLVDTMGMSQRDRMVTEQIGMLTDCGVQRLLLLNATARGDTMDDVIAAYRGVGLAGCILTKVDEAASLAPVLDVVMRYRLNLHYVSNGQRVPEDLHLPNRPYLLHRAFKGAPEASPHRFDGLESGLVMANAGVAALGGRHG